MTLAGASGDELDSARDRSQLLIGQLEHVVFMIVIVFNAHLFFRHGLPTSFSRRFQAACFQSNLPPWSWPEFLFSSLVNQE